MRALQAQQWRSSLDNYKIDMQKAIIDHHQKRILQLESILDGWFSSQHGSMVGNEKVGPSPVYTPRPRISKPFNSAQRRVLRKQGRPFIDMSAVKNGSFADSDSAGGKVQGIETSWQVQRDYTAGLQAELNEKNTRLKSTETLLERLQVDVCAAHEKERSRWAHFLDEFKQNCERELLRRQGEVAKLHQLLSCWINRFMELQEQVGIPSGPGHRRRLSEKYEAELHELCSRTASQATGLHSSLKNIQHLASESPWSRDTAGKSRTSYPSISAGDSPLAS